jgi:polar amino acid transport system substrate-binding protein
MKLLVAAALVGVLGATLAAAAFAQPAGDLPTKKPDTLVIGFDLPAPAFIQGTAVGTSIRNPTGFEVELAKAVAKKLGVSKIEWLRSKFVGLFRPGAKPFDFAFEQITITAKRKQVVDFSASYFDANQGVLIAKGVSKPTSIADLRGLQICAQAATTGLDYIQTQMRPEKDPLVYQDLGPAFIAVSTGQCDAIVMDVPIVVSEKKKSPAKYGAVAGQIITNEKYGALFEKGNPLRAQVSNAIKELKADGTLARLQSKWFSPFPNVTVLK